MKNIQRLIHLFTLISGISTSLMANVGNELIFNVEDGKKYGVSRLDLETYTPSEAQQITSALETAFGEPTLGELNRESSTRQFHQSTRESGGLAEAHLDIEFAELDGAGFLTQSISSYYKELGEMEKKMLFLRDPVKTSFPVNDTGTTSIPNESWEQVYFDTGNIRVALNYESPEAPGPLGSRIKSKIFYAGSLETTWRDYVSTMAPFIGRRVTEDTSMASLSTVAEVKLFWGISDMKMSVDAKLARVDIKFLGEVGLKGSISGTFSVANSFVDRNESNTGSSEFSLTAAITITAYGELGVEITITGAADRQWAKFQIKVGLELIGSISCRLALEARDWDHTLDDVGSKPQEQGISLADITLSLKGQAYVKVVWGDIEIKPAVAYSVSKTFSEKFVSGLPHMRALDQYM